MEAFLFALTGMMPAKLIHDVFQASGSFQVAEIVDKKGGINVGEVNGVPYFVKPYHGRKRRRKAAFERYLGASKKL